MRNYLTFCLVLLTLAGIAVSPGSTQALDRDLALKRARKYIETEDTDKRERLAEKLADWPSDEIESLLAELSAGTFEPVEAGYHPEEHFSVPELRKKHPKDLLYFTVPKSYRPDRATGLIVFMHGGGNTSSRRTPRYFMNFPDEGDDESSQLGNLFEATGMIAVGPSAPWDEESSYRWCLEEADEYLANVVRECRSRFNIDPHRVFLIGHSMGGFGAYHHIQRQPDRFAGVVVNAGSWELGHWPVIRGTKLCVVQGVYDAEKGSRWHYTDIAYARWTDKLLAREKYDYVYYEHEGGHAVYHGKEQIARFLKSNAGLRRDPYHPHVTLASPVGFTRWYCFPVEHNRWLTLDKAAPGKITYEELRCDHDVAFDDWELTYQRSKRTGSSIDAVNQGNNTLAVTTRNVARFTVWLHPKMVDFRKPVTVLVDGTERFRGKVQPSLVTALDSYRRRGDWGLIYTAKVEVGVKDEGGRMKEEG